MDKSKHDIKRTINQIIREKGRFPAESDMCAALNFSPEQSRKYMAALEEDGYLVRIGDWYRYPEASPSPSEEAIPLEVIPMSTLEKSEEDGADPPDIISEAKPKGPISDKIGELFSIRRKEGRAPFVLKKKRTGRKSVIESSGMGFAVFAIRLSMLIVGAGSIIISVYYNMRFSMEFLPGVLAIIAGAIFVLFSVVSFEVILLFLSFKRMDLWKRAVSILGFVLLWFVVTIFSMSATVSGRYERYMSNQQAYSGENRGVSAGRLKWKSIQDRKQEITQRIQDKRVQIEQLRKIASGIEDISSREAHGTTFADTQWRASLAEKELDRYTQALENIRIEEAKQLELNPESTAADESAGKYASFYMWLGTVFSVPEEKIHFAISLMPAFFFDLVSPCAIAIFLFLRKE